jgi:hypothetical protein
MRRLRAQLVIRGVGGSDWDLLGSEGLVRSPKDGCLISFKTCLVGGSGQRGVKNEWHIYKSFSNEMGSGIDSSDCDYIMLAFCMKITSTSRLNANSCSFCICNKTQSSFHCLVSSSLVGQIPTLDHLRTFLPVLFVSRVLQTLSKLPGPPR